MILQEAKIVTNFHDYKMHASTRFSQDNKGNKIHISQFVLEGFHFQILDCLNDAPPF
jgi:hypothetical protein